MSAGLIESGQRLLAGILELGRTRFELLGVELREELARLAAAILGGLAVLMLGALALAFAGAAVVLYAGEANRLAAVAGVALFFLAAAGLVAWRVRRVAAQKPRAFDATLSELEQDLKVLRP
jgi:uncharacterized membrane protein YqjE